MPLSKLRPFCWGAAGALLPGLMVVTHAVWLGALGDFLVRSQEPFRADAIVVPAGGYRGNRILKAAELAKQGFAPLILVSGPDGFYGYHESELAIQFAVNHGYPRDWFIAVPNHSRSTEEEARDMVRELRRRNVRRFILVTSAYHTRRASEVYRDLAPELEFRTVAASDPDYPKQWWRSRQGQKTVFLEWSKTLAYWVGL